MKMTDVIDELVEVVGRENVSEDRLDKLAYATDASRIQGETRLIVWAKSREDVSKVVSWAGERGVGITVRGAGSGLVGGCVPKTL
jgi:FAD/FMN-containing dehydrogenase